MNNVEDRLSKVERSNRWWRFIALLAFGIASLRVLTGAGESPSFDTITANRVNVVDAKGNLVGALMGQSGDGTLILTSSKSKGQVIVGAWGSFAMQNAGGKEIVSLYADDDANGAVLLSSSASKGQVFIKATTQPSIGLKNADGNLVVALAGDAEGAGLVSVCSAAGKDRIELDGHFVPKPPAEPSDAAGISLFAENGEQRASLGAGGASASLGLSTHDGKGASVILNASDVEHTCIQVRQPGNGTVSHMP
jgi:hypothetical protein